MRAGRYVTPSGMSFERTSFTATADQERARGAGPAAEEAPGRDRRAVQEADIVHHAERDDRHSLSLSPHALRSAVAPPTSNKK
jgi:hypothetical protein